MTTGSVVVEAVGVGKVFGTGDSAVTALPTVDLTIRQGEFVSLIGPSGCGKSTFLRIIGDLTRRPAGPCRSTASRRAGAT